ncbi:MAG: alpha/beta fold hydrolase [Candidatus Izemoplasmataceae bacterium]
MRESRFLNLGDINIHIMIEGANFPLFILHGGPGLDHHYFGNYLDNLLDEFKLIFVDLRGNGLSEMGDKSALTVKQMAKDISKIAEILKLTEYAVMGHSFGGFVALEHATMNSKNLKFTVLMNTLHTAFDASNNECFLKLDKKLLKSIEENNKILSETYKNGKNNHLNEETFIKQSFINSLPLYFPTSPHLMNDFIALLDQTCISVKTMQIMNSSNYGNYEVLHRLDQIHTNVLIVTSDYDCICNPKHSYDMHHKIPKSELHTFRGVGHFPFIEQPSLLASLIIQFKNNL